MTVESGAPWVPNRVSNETDSQGSTLLAGSQCLHSSKDVVSKGARSEEKPSCTSKTALRTLSPLRPSALQHKVAGTVLEANPDPTIEGEKILESLIGP
jgi:hypothetical protein